MKNWKNNIIPATHTVREALGTLNNLGIASSVLFVTNEHGKLLGSLTDGDIRRGILKDATLADKVTEIMNDHCYRIIKKDIHNELINEFRKKQIFYVPVVNDDGVIEDVLNFKDYKDIIPVDAVIMAGGRGERLLPLTLNTPKPLLKIGDKPIIEHNIDRLVEYGIKNIQISINYLGEQIENYFGDGDRKGVSIKYIREERPLGTIGAVSLAETFEQDTILLMNSDLLTNIDYGNFYNEFIRSGASMAVATVPHHVDLPYAILELDEERVISLQEKPRYTYFANAGIYLIRTDLLECIPKGKFFNATDMMEKVIGDGKKLINYVILEYWLDIGRINDYRKAQEDILHLGL